MKLLRNIFLTLIWLIAATDVAGMALLYYYPDFLNFGKLAVEYNWLITDFWVETVVWISLGMLVAISITIFRKLDLAAMLIMAIVSTGWAYVLIFVANDHISKLLDGSKWAANTVFVVGIYIIDTLKNRKEMHNK